MTNSSVILQDKKGNSLLKTIDRHSVVSLILISFAQYLPTLFYGYTDLDDCKFIFAENNFDARWDKLIPAFTKGVFPNTGIPYYRPVFVDFLLLHKIVFGQSVMGFHLVNVVLHVICVWMLFRFLRRLRIEKMPALLLAGLFAVHPALAQAVAWIPGCNDTLLFLFAVCYFINFLDFQTSGKAVCFWQCVFWSLLALFTKETAIAIFPAGWLLLCYDEKYRWKSSRILTHSAASVLAVAIWAYAATNVQSVTKWFHLKQMSIDLYLRLPVIVQYLGKAFLPFNLGVYPTQNQISLIPGLISVFALGIIIFLRFRRKIFPVIAGFVFFILVLLPSLLIPYATVNRVVFEHRLYLPLIGLLLLTDQLLFERRVVPPKISFYFMLFLIILFSFFNFYRMSSFQSPRDFWSDAEKCSPRDAYVHMMRAVYPETPDQTLPEFQRAYQLNPNLKFFNFQYALYWLSRDSVEAAEKFLKKELSLYSYYPCHYYLMKIALNRRQYPVAMDEMRKFIAGDPHAKNLAVHGGMLNLTATELEMIVTACRKRTANTRDLTAACLAHMGLT